MTETEITGGMASINGAQLYYELAGEGPPFVMVHAGIADNRQWNNEFAHFADRYRVVRYDMRGYGQSEPVPGDFSHRQDLTTLLDQLNVTEPIILMGCSMGGGIAMESTLAHPSQVRALIMVGSGPSGLELDVPSPDDTFALAQEAFDEGDLERTCELEMQIWFDGMGRTADEVDPEMRQLAYEMNLIALRHEVKARGTRQPNAAVPAAERLDELTVPLLIIVGAYDLPYIHAAARVMAEAIPHARVAHLEDAAHLPNMEQPAAFQQVVSTFLEEALS